MEHEKKEKIYVIVRVRPLSKEEATARSPWKLSSKSIASNKSCRPSFPSHTYTFDRIYGTKTPTLDIYNAHIKDIVATTMSGLNGTILAYGQSGSGKTYTLRGSAEEAGILMLAVQDMFQIVQEASNREFLIRMSYLEVAEDELNDLLASKTHKLDIREDAELGVSIAGLREEIVSKSEQVLSLLEFAEARRAVDSTSATNRGVSHTIFRLVIESSSFDKKDDPFGTHERDGYQISVLNLVEVAPAKANGGKNDNISQVAVQADKCVMSLQSVMSKLSEGGANAGGCVPYNESRLTHILRPSLGGNARTCFICNISPAMVHMNETIEALDFALKTTKVINCFKVNEVYTDKALLKRQRKEIVKLRNKLKELQPPDLEDEILNRRNALLMIEVEKEQMSLELYGKTPSSSQGENKEQDQERRAENITFEGESRLGKCSDISSVDCDVPLQKRNSRNYLGYFSAPQRLQELDLDLQTNCTGLCLNTNAGTKRKRNSITTAVADKGDFPFQSKAARDVNWMKSEGRADSERPVEMQTFIAQENMEQDVPLQADEHCRNLERKIEELEAEKALLQKRLCEQEISHSKEVETLKHKLSLEKSRRTRAEVAQEGVLETSTSRASDALGIQEDSSLERQQDREDAAVKQNAETRSCTSQENEDQQKISKEKEGQNNPTKKNLKVNKVYQKFQTFQGRSELSNLRKELAVAKETITALEDERISLWKKLNQMKLKCKQIQDKLEANKIEEDSKGEHNYHQLLAAAVDTLKAEVESTASITDDLLALLSESFRILAADLKSFQEGVAEIKVLNGATADMSETFEYAKTQLLALRRGKLASDKELNSMKSELAKLECVVERQSGVLKVLSDNENLLNELASVRAALKEAAGASELQMSSIQQEYETRLKELDSDNKHSKQKYLQLEEEQSRLQDKLSTAEAEVLRLTHALDEKSKRPAKNIKARLAEAEAEIVLLNDQLKEKSLSEEDRRKVEEEFADSRAEVEKLRKEVEEKSRLEKEYNHILTKLSKSEAVVAKLTAANEEQKQVELEQKDIQIKLECEIVKMTKQLEEKSGVEEQQKRIQADLATLQEKIENLTEEAQQKDVLEKKHCELLLRLDTAEKEVTRLTELLNNSKEQSEHYLEEMLERSRNSDAEVVTLSESLQREMEERLRLEEEHSKNVEDIGKLEIENSRMADSLKQALQEKEEEHMKDSETIINLKVEIKELTQSLSSLTEMQEVIENEKRTRLDAMVKLEAELKLLAESLSQELGHREKLEKELRESHDKSLELEAEVEKLTENLHRSIQGKDETEKVHRKDLEVIADSEIKIRSMTENLQHCLEEKISLERELRKALEDVASTEAIVSELTGVIERHKEEKKGLEEELKKALDDHTNSVSQVTRLVEQLDEEVEEKKKLEKKVEEIASKLAFTEEEVVNMAESLNQVTKEKSLSDWKNCELLETCTLLKLENAKLSENITTEVEVSEKLERKPDGAFEIRARLTKIGTEKEKELRTSVSPTMHDEAGQLREILARELDTRRKLEIDHAQVLDQLNLSRMEAANLSESSKIGSEDSRSYTTDNSHNILKLSASRTHTDSLNDVLEGKSRLEEELQKFQLDLAGSEAEILRLNEELIVKGSLQTEFSRSQRQLTEVTEEVRKLRDEKRKLEEEQMKVLDRSTSPDADMLRLSGNLRERTTLTDEVQAVRFELNESKAELVSVRTALRDKLGLEETLIKTQIELVDKQGECEKLTKELRVNRKMVKEQKKLLQKLASTQSEVSRLRTAMVGASEDQNVKIQPVERTDPTMTGLPARPNTSEERDREHARLRDKLAATETEVMKLTVVIEEKKKLEEDHARVQIELVKAEAEIQRLTAALMESSSLNKEREKKWKEQEQELQITVAALEEKVNLVEKKTTSQNYHKCAECEVFQTLVEQIRKERDDLRERCAAAQTKLKTLQAELENQRKELEIVERNWKTKCQKNEKELAELRQKFAKLEEGTGRIVQEKKVLEERLSCSEAQISAVRESARATSKELEMAHHKLHVLQSQHQSHVAAFCGELSMKTARTAELEKELKTLLSHPPPPLPSQAPPPPPPPAPVMQNEFANYITSPFRQQGWSFPPPLQTPQQPSSHHHEPHWGSGAYKGAQR